MRLPTQKKILREDVNDAKDLIDPLNSFMESVYQALNKNITLQENIASFVYELSYSTPATYPTGVLPVSILNQLRTRPIGVQVLQAVEKSTYDPAPGPVFVPWAENSAGGISLRTITGLEASKTYLIRLLVV